MAATTADEIVRPTKQRLASEYQEVEKAVLNRGQYPCTLPTVSRPTHDLAYYQSILNHGSNFADQTTCDLFDVGADGIGRTKTGLHHDELRSYIKESVRSNMTNRMRVIYFTSKRAKNTTFASQISLQHTLAFDLLQAFQVSPHFVSLLLGEPDYGAPGVYHDYDSQGKLCSQEYMCQHPRWDSHTKLQPCSVYMNFQRLTAVTTYIIVSGDSDSCIDVAKKRAEDALTRSAFDPASLPPASDPFLIHHLIAHESFLQSRQIMTKLRHRLYDALDNVDAYGNGDRSLDRSALRALTNELHLISQDADSLVSSTEMGTMVVERMSAAHTRLKTVSDNAMQQGFSLVEDCLIQLVQTLHARKRWLLSYKSRKDIAMNLVFNLVTQQDSETNMSIAQATKNDSAAMKTIAAMTMVFLPATAVSSFFGMAFFNGQGKSLTVTSNWWIFLATTVPMTIMLFLIWLKWNEISSALEIVRRVTTVRWASMKPRPRSDSDSEATRVNCELSAQSSKEKDVSKMV